MKNKLLLKIKKNGILFNITIALLIVGNLQAQELISQDGKKLTLSSGKNKHGYASTIILDGTEGRYYDVSIRSALGYGKGKVSILSETTTSVLGTSGINLHSYGKLDITSSQVIFHPSDPWDNGPLKVGIGTETPDEMLTVNGKIHAKGVKVDLVGWPDYVFENTYILPTLAQVETFIKNNGHLEDIPSACEVEKNGIELGEVNKLLLQKIEELTLYTIDQEKQLTQQEVSNQKLKTSIEKMQAKNQALENRLAKLEQLLMKK